MSNEKELPKVINKETVFNDFLTIEKASLEMNGKPFSRLNVISPDSVGCVLFNMDTKNVIMLEQYRYSAGGYIYEIPAGRIDEGETEIEATEREMLEETGYSIKGKKLERICTYYPNVGTTSEKITLFMAIVSNKDRIKTDIGVNSETEIIELKEFNVDEIVAMMDSGEIKDGKSIIGLNHWLKRIISQMYNTALDKAKEELNKSSEIPPTPIAPEGRIIKEGESGPEPPTPLPNRVIKEGESGPAPTNI